MHKLFSLTLFFLAIQIGNTQTLPVNPNASAEAKQLLNYIYNLDDQILAGQHSYNEESDKFYEEANRISGKYPAVWGTDFYWNGQDDPGERIVKAAINKHNEGAIVTLMWHVGRPMDNAPYPWSTSVQDEVSQDEWKELVTPGTSLYKKWLAQVDNVAEHLKKLRDAHIPILWRPYHEMNGVWFWWGDKKGEDGFQKLWQNLYDRMVSYHKLDNLLWVWNANGPRDIPQDEAFAYAHYYPGSAYVDILATDVYHNDYEQKDYEELLDLANGKPIALGEVGQLPKVNVLEAQPKWSWFMVWSNWLHTANTENRVQDVYNYDKTLTRDEVEIKY